MLTDVRDEDAAQQSPQFAGDFRRYARWTTLGSGAEFDPALVAVIRVRPCGFLHKGTRQRVSVLPRFVRHFLAMGAPRTASQGDLH